MNFINPKLLLLFFIPIALIIPFFNFANAEWNEINVDDFSHNFIAQEYNQVVSLINFYVTILSQLILDNSDRLDDHDIELAAIQLELDANQLELDGIQDDIDILLEFMAENNGG